MTTKIETRPCPVCKGAGELPGPHKQGRDLAAERKAMARTLRKAGYSFRQIRDFLGWKSVRSAAAACE